MVHKMSRAKHWVFTLNNYTSEDEERIREAAEHFKYVIFGREVGESGTAHLQGYVSIGERKGLSWLRATISPRAHFEVMHRNSTPQKAAAYCRKDGDFEEYGELPPGCGHRSDLVCLYGDIRAGKGEDEVEEAYPAQFIRYQRSIQSLLRKYTKPREGPPTVKVFWGRTGTGKTKTVYESHALEEIYSHPGGSWFDGYHGQEVALFDDFGGSEFKLTYLLKLLDRYPMNVPIKGSFVVWKPKTIYMTSNRPPEDWYMNAHSSHVEALVRRFTTVQHFE